MFQNDRIDPWYSDVDSGREFGMAVLAPNKILCESFDRTKLGVFVENLVPYSYHSRVRVFPEASRVISR